MNADTGKFLVRIIMPFFLVTGIAGWIRLSGGEPGASEEQVDPAVGETLGRFIRQYYAHGVPKEQATKFGPGAVPILRDILKTNDNAAYWSNAVESIGYIDGPEAHEILVEFLNEKVGEVGPSEFDALLSVPVSLGRLAKQGEPRAYEYLRKLCDLEASPANGYRWHYRHYSGQRLVDLFGELGVNGISIIGDERSQKFLANLLVEAVPPKRELILRGEIEQGLRAIDLKREGQKKNNSNAQPKGAAPSPPPGQPGSRRRVRETGAHSLGISAHKSISISDQEVDNIFDAASSLLRINNRSCADEVACEVVLARKNNVSSFGSILDGFDVITESAELSKVLDFSGAFKVVLSVEICQDTPGAYSGCSEPGRGSVIEVSKPSHIWAHEFGHNQGLKDFSQCSRSIMHIAATDTNAVNQYECGRFRMSSEVLHLSSIEPVVLDEKGD